MIEFNRNRTRMRGMLAAGALIAMNADSAVGQQETFEGNNHIQSVQDVIASIGGGQDLGGNGQFVVDIFISNVEKQMRIEPGSSLARGLVTAILRQPRSREQYLLDYAAYQKLDHWWGGAVVGGSEFAQMVCAARPEVFFSDIFTQSDFKKTAAYADVPMMLACIDEYQKTSPVEFAAGGRYINGIQGMTADVLTYVLNQASDEYKTRFKERLTTAYSSVSSDRIVEITPEVAHYAFGEDAEKRVIELYRASLNSTEAIGQSISQHEYFESNKKVMYSPEVHAQFRSIIIESMISRIVALSPDVPVQAADEIDSTFVNSIRYRKDIERNFPGYDKQRLARIHPDIAQLASYFYEFAKLDYADIPSVAFAHIFNARLHTHKDLHTLDQYIDFTSDDQTPAEMLEKARPLIDTVLLDAVIQNMPPVELQSYLKTLMLTHEASGILALRRILTDAENRFNEDPFSMLKVVTSLNMIVAKEKSNSAEFVRMYDAFEEKAYNAFKDESLRGQMEGDARVVFSIMHNPERGPYIMKLMQRGRLHMTATYGPTEFMTDYKSGMGKLFKPWAEHIDDLQDKGPEAQYYLYQLFKTLLSRNVPADTIAEQIASGTFGLLVQKEKEVQAFWDVFGKHYDSRGDVSRRLQILDITQPIQYAEMLAVIDRIPAFSRMGDYMMEHVDFSLFDEQVRTLLSEGKAELLIEQIISFGNQTRPQNISTYFERIAQTHGEDFKKWTETFVHNREAVLDIHQLSRIWSLTQVATYAKEDTFLQLTNESTLRDVRPIIFTVNSTFFKEIKTPQQWAQLQSILTFLEGNGGSAADDVNLRISLDGNSDSKSSLAACKDAARSIDLTMLLHQQGGVFPEPSVVEQVRVQVNAMNRQEGDRLVITSAAQYLKGKDAVSNISELMHFGKIWNDYGRGLHTSSERDVAGIYQLVSNFALGKAAALLSSKDATETQRGEYAGYLSEAGFPIDERESNLMKGIKRFAGAPLSTTAKGFRKIMGANDSYIGEVSTLPYERTMQEGVTVNYVCMNMRTCTAYDAHMIALKADQNLVEMSLITNKSGTVDREAIKKDRTDRMTAIFPVTFTSGPRKLTDLAAYKGEMMSWLLKIDGNDGLVVATEDGMMGILNKQAINLAELRAIGIKLPEDSLRGKETLQITKSLEDFELFINIVASARLSLQTNMLLLNDGETFKVGGDSLDSRRLLLTFPDGNIGVLSSFATGKNISTNDAVALAKRLGAQRAVYCDTGMYDFAQIFDVTQQAYTVGWQDSEASTNVAVMSTRRAPLK